MPTNLDFVRCTRLLGLDVNHKGRREEGTTENELHLLMREGARHPASKKFLLEVVLYVMHMRVSRRAIRENNHLC